MNEPIGFERVDEFASRNAFRQFQALTKNSGRFGGCDESLRRDFLPFLGEFIHDHMKHLADVFYRFFPGIAPRCGSDGFESGTVRPKCGSPVLVLVILDDDFENIGFSRNPPWA